MAAGVVQPAPAGSARADLARRRPAEVAARTGVWAAVIAVDRIVRLAELRWERLR